MRMIMLLVTRVACAALVLACAITYLSLSVRAALACSDHELRLHLSWNAAKNADNFDEWKRAFEVVDVDRDGTIASGDIADVFKVHFNILHDNMDPHHKKTISRAEQRHYRDEAAAFLGLNRDEKEIHVRIICAASRSSHGYKV